MLKMRRFSFELIKDEKLNVNINKYIIDRRSLIDSSLSFLLKTSRDLLSRRETSIFIDCCLFEIMIFLFDVTSKNDKLLFKRFVDLIVSNVIQ